MNTMLLRWGSPTLPPDAPEDLYTDARRLQTKTNLLQIEYYSTPRQRSLTTCIMEDLNLMFDPSRFDAADDETGKREEEAEEESSEEGEESSEKTGFGDVDCL